MKTTMTQTIKTGMNREDRPVVKVIHRVSGQIVVGLAIALDASGCKVLLRPGNGSQVWVPYVD